VDVGSVADISEIRACDFDPEMEEACISEILATLLASSQCKDPRAESTSTVKLSNFLIQFEGERLQLFGHVKGLDRTRIRGRALELLLRPKVSVG
jgi:hypothetical protein